MKKVKISVIIPIYNVEKYLDECLSSIINQTFTDIEIICINDGSTDKSKVILDSYAQKDNRIVVIDKKNGGLSSARNVGIDIASGEYIIFVDSDDYLDLKALEIFYSILSKEELDTLFFGAEVVYESHIDESKLRENYLSKGEYKSIKCGQELFHDMRKNGDYFPSACLQINRLSLLKNNNIKFLEGIIHEDEPFTLNVTLVSQRAMKLADLLYKRRIREGSIMTSMDLEDNKIKSSYGYFKGMMEIIPKINQYVQKEKILESYNHYLDALRNASARKIQDIRRDYRYFRICENKEDFLLYNYMIIEYAEKKEKIESLNQELKQLQKSKVWKKIFQIFKRKLKRIWIIYFSNLYVCGPKISVIMPIHNGEAYLKEALESLRKQKLKNIEVLCIDDGSTDNSINILKQYASIDKRFKIFQKEHSNAGDARNLGILKAKGEYLLFLDSDDIFDEKLCKTTYYHAKLNKLDILLFGSNQLFMTDMKIVSRDEPIFNTGIVPNKIYNPRDISNFLFQICYGNAWSKLYNRKFVLDNKLKFQSLSNINDAYFTRISLTKANRIMAIKSKLVTYRTNINSNTSITNTRDNHPLCFYEACLAIQNDLAKAGTLNCYGRSFKNMVMNEFVTQYSTMKTEKAKQILKNKFKIEGSKQLGLEDLKCTDIDYHDIHEEFLNIMNS